MYFQDKTEKQLKYYKDWNKTSFLGYKAFRKIFQELHPYQFVDEGSVIFTVGCQASMIRRGGSQPLIYSSIIGDSGKVIVIEPDPTSIKALTKYTKEHNITNIKIVDKAVWHKNGSLKFNFYDGKIPCGVHSIREKISGKSGKHSTVVESRTLNSLIEEFGKPDFINLTINGSEHAALLGLDLTKNIKISMAMVARKTVLDPEGKWSIRLFDERLKALKLLEENGYKIAIADACPRPWNPKKFYVAVGIKDISKAINLGFNEGSKIEIAHFLGQ